MIDVITLTKLIIIGISAVVILNYSIRFIFSKNAVHALCLKVGLDPISVREMLFIMLTALSLGYLTKNSLPDVSYPLLYFAWASPIIGLINIFINTQFMRKYISEIPFFGNYLTCPLATEKKVKQVKEQMQKNGINQSEIDTIKQCKFTCPNCRGVDAIKIAGGWSLTNIIVPWIYKSIML